jgi:hypothetical protein
VKKILRFVSQAACLLLVAAGLLAALAATFCLLAMLIVWFQEGALQPADRTIVAWGVKWLLGSGVLIAVAWWLRGKIVPNQTTDGSFRLIDVQSSLSETKLLQNISDLVLLVLLVIWLWPHLPGGVLSKTSVFAGWLMICFLGMHTRIALHEIGHLAAARLLALELRKIQVGVGPLLWSHTFANGLRSEWRARPQGGYLFATHSKTDGYRARQSLFVAAGPIADLIILWSAYQLITHAFGGLAAASIQGPGELTAFLLFWWTALSAVGGLVPQMMWVGHCRMWTDGYWLLRLLTGSNAQITEFARSSDWRARLDLLQSESSQTSNPPGVGGGELPGHLAGSTAFHEQRELLSSRLLRKPSFIFGPPA